MYQANITVTYRGYHPTAEWTRGENEQVQAETLAELKTELIKRYGRSWRHKRPMYRDRKNGPPVQTGWVVGRRMQDIDWKYLQQDWISITEEKEAAV